MAYILLALGALMSLVGLAAMVTGYPSIEMERGWATVITGAVLLSGGLVVVGLGFILRNLVGLRAALANVGDGAAAAAATGPQPIVVPTPLTPPMPAMPHAPVLAERPSVPHPQVSAAPALAAAVAPAAAVLAVGAAYAHKTLDPAAEPGSHRASDETPHVEEPSLPEADAIEADDPGHAAEPVEAHGGEHEHTRDEDHVAAASRPRSSEDLLDQAFSAFDYEMANSHPPTGQVVSAAAGEHEGGLANHQAHEPPFHQTTEPQDEPQDVEPHATEGHASVPESEVPATAPTEPATNLAVIGRYDSEGTSYVMYSDGSIEAQSEAGVYRFNSMAELKAFIEG